MTEEAFENFEILYEDRKSYLYAFIKGKIDNLETSLDYWTKLKNKCKERGRRKLLVAQKFDNQVSMLDMLKIGEHIAELTHGYYLQIACIDEEIDHDILNKFGETVAVNRGAALQVFESFKDAETWLLRR